jgi:hypothetical protein
VRAKISSTGTIPGTTSAGGSYQAGRRYSTSGSGNSGGSDVVITRILIRGWLVQKYPECCAQRADGPSRRSWLAATTLPVSIGARSDALRSELAMATWVGPLSGRLAWIQKSGFPLLPKPAEPSRSISSW